MGWGDKAAERKIVMKNRTKIILAALAAVCLVTLAAYDSGDLVHALDHILPGEVVCGLGMPESTVRIGGKELRYRETRKVDITEAMKVRNGKVSDTGYVYLEDGGNVYTVDKSYQLLSFSRVGPMPEDAPPPEADVSKAEIDAAIAGAAALGIELTENRLDSSGRAEYGWQLNFNAGKDPRIEDYVMVILDWERGLSSLIVDNSSIDSMDEVDVEFFDGAFAEYCQGLETQPKEITVDYKRYGDAIVARYSLVFEDEPLPGREDGARWADMVSFKKKS